jgi:hypothetical protein
MAKSRKDPKRAQKAVEFKNKHKRRNMEKINEAPKVMQSPVWQANDTIEVNGAEWQAIADFISQSERAVMAFHAVMNKNVLNGTIKMKFQKLSEAGTEYVDVTPEEDAKYQADFQNMLNQANDLARKAVAAAKEQELATSQEGLPQLDALVAPDGTPAGEENKAKIITL